MIDVESVLYELCGDKRVFDPECDLVESGIMDSYAFIELFACLEGEGIEINPTRIDRNLLRSVEGIKSLIREHGGVLRTDDPRVR